jgi:hypothetical protein
LTETDSCSSKKLSQAERVKNKGKSKIKKSLIPLLYFSVDWGVSDTFIRRLNRQRYALLESQRYSFGKVSQVKA